ncbi:MAG TPA: hypothetical protein VNJ02_14915, partial [Vicinamibacterales bacterium]|nr:hypothetical protein [Vicinamibacterales bacterium]
FLTAIGASTAGHSDVKPGDTIRGSDDGEIGTVDKVVAATTETEGYLLMPRGLIFKTDTYIPLDAVVRRNGTDVFINIPNLIIGSMPWDKPPSRAERRAKQGPLATDVDKLYGSRAPSGQKTSAHR